jgi:hypothetical protein
MPRAYNDKILAAQPAKRRACLGSIFGSPVPWPVAWHRELHLSKVARHRFPAWAVAAIAAAASFRLLLLRAEMVGQFGTPGPFQECFGELLQPPLGSDHLCGALADPPLSQGGFSFRLVFPGLS